MLCRSAVLRRDWATGLSRSGNRSYSVVVALMVTLLQGMPNLCYAGNIYQTPENFLHEVFENAPPEPSIIWLSGERKQASIDILEHRYASLRVRYWASDQKSAWILEEVGKDQPITAGFVIENGKLNIIKVLAFRESRGFEIRHSFFTDQFKNAELDEQRRLSNEIDGISGATLSVRAMKKMATLALYLDSTRKNTDVTSSP